MAAATVADVCDRRVSACAGAGAGGVVVDAAAVGGERWRGERAASGCDAPSTTSDSADRRHRRLSLDARAAAARRRWPPRPLSSCACTLVAIDAIRARPTLSRVS